MPLASEKVAGRETRENRELPSPESAHEYERRIG
jgi:hypothetical protein